MLSTYADIMLRVALDVGAARYPSGTDNSPTLPTDPATLFKIRDAVNRGRVEFYGDFPDAQFRRRLLTVAIGSAVTTYQVTGDPSSYLLPVDWLGPPQGSIVVTGAIGGSVTLTSMDRVRLAFAQIGTTLGFPLLMACEKQPEPQLGEEGRWLLRVYPSPDQAYSLALRGRWRASPIVDIRDAEPTGHGDAIAAYATAYLVERGYISTGVGAPAAAAHRDSWRIRVL